ncbi:putative TULIP family P47-like protein [Seiridium cardinale]|uniref:TULIP family P47-like protein n=1 Tax=Seiridium cardinale TaxID=138064 RepID=A0ABR2Y5M0_9PEZI
MSVITTNGWDTVFATNYANLNAQIAAQWQTLITKAPSLAHLVGELAKYNVKMDLTTSAWKLTQGGSGSLVNLSLPIASGIFKGIGGSYDLAGQSITIQLGLQWVPQPNQIHFSINSNLQAIQANLDAQPTVTDNVKNAFAAGDVTLAATATVTVITKGVCWRIEDPVSKVAFYVYVTNSGGAPLLIEVYQYVTNSLVIKPPTAINPVTVIYAGNITDPVDGPIFKELVTSNIDQNLKAFEFVFATVDVVTQLVPDDVWSWLQPTSNGYAVVEPLNSPSNDNCIFAIMSMVANRVNPNPVLQVDVNAIGQNCTSSLLISPGMFLLNMLAPGVQTIFKGSNKTDFTLDEKNLSITNKNTLTWANVTLEDGKDATLTVGPGNFSMTVQNDRISINFTNLSYPITLLGAEVGRSNIIFSGQFQLSLKTGTNGNRTLWFDVPKDQLLITNVSSVMNDTFYTIEQIMGWVTVGLSLIAIGGAVGKAVATKAAQTALVNAGRLEANATAADVRIAFQEVLQTQPMRQAFIGEADAAALELMQNAKVSLQKANMWASVSKWTAAFAGITGLTAGGMLIEKSILEKAA